jgi:hypothetical protein
MSVLGVCVHRNGVPERSHKDEFNAREPGDTVLPRRRRDVLYSRRHVA